MLATPGAAQIAEVVTDLGDGPPVVLLHGVGFGPETMQVVATEVAATARAVVLRRPVQHPGAGLDVQVAAVAAAIRAHLGGAPATIAGVSGGATLGLALAIRAPELVAGVVLHEPLVGEHAAALHALVTESAARLGAGTLTAEAWFEALVGVETWAALPPALTQAALAAAPDLAAEVEPFVGWAPSGAGLGSLRGHGFLSTVGARSGSARREAAAVLEAAAGFRTVVLGGAGHLVQLDVPRQFAELATAEARRHEGAS